MEECLLDDDFYQLSLALQIARKSNCLRRKFGAVLCIPNYAGRRTSPTFLGFNFSLVSCQTCARKEAGVAHGADYDICSAVHAEQFAIMNAMASEITPYGFQNSVLYVAGFAPVVNKGTVIAELIESYNPCTQCKELIKKVGIPRVVGFDCNLNIVEWDSLTTYGQMTETFLAEKEKERR